MWKFKHQVIKHPVFLPRSRKFPPPSLPAAPPVSMFLTWSMNSCSLVTLTHSCSTWELLQQLWPHHRSNPKTTRSPPLFFSFFFPYLPRCWQASSKAAMLTKTLACSGGLAQVNAALWLRLASCVSEHDTAADWSTSLCLSRDHPHRPESKRQRRLTSAWLENN